MTTSIVSMLMEGGMDYSDFYGVSSVDSSKYTLESGAAIIARESVEELHEIFEVAVINTNEAVLAAYMEGNRDVMESATYSAVFEAEEKSAGQKILDFLRKLKDKVITFFRNIAAKVSLFLNDYEKFFKKKKDDILKAQNERKEPAIKDVSVKDWNNTKIDNLANDLTKAAGDISEIATEVVGIVKKWAEKVSDHDTDKVRDKSLEMCEDLVTKKVRTVASSFIPGTGSGDFDMSRVNAELAKLFVGEKNKTITLDIKYVEGTLMNTKKEAASIKDAQKSFNKAYDEAIKTIKAITEDMERRQKRGYTAYIHKATAAMQKIQTIMNAYAGAGYRALIARANESKALCNVLISGNRGKFDESKK